MAKVLVVEAPRADAQPSELNELTALVDEFVDRSSRLDNEIELLKQDKKQLVEDFSEKLDIKTLNAALRIAKIKRDNDRKDTLDTFLTILESKEP